MAKIIGKGRIKLGFKELFNLSDKKTTVKNTLPQMIFLTEGKPKPSQKQMKVKTQYNARVIKSNNISVSTQFNN